MLSPLPIDDVLAEIQTAVLAGSTVLRAPPGAGKTSRVPPAILGALSDSDRRIILVQPRRLAARTAARRIAHEWGCDVGQEVGYAVRFDSRQSPATRILVVTDGVLLRMLQQDPLLEDVQCVIFDEFHERALTTDLALAMVHRVRSAVRPELKIVVMSATLDPAPIVQYLGDATAVECEGRAFPVDVQYLRRQDRRARIVEVAVTGVTSMLEKVAGDLLVFLPGVGEIRQTEQLLESLANKQGITIQTLYGNMSPEHQDRVVHSLPNRRVVLATNVAETSVTLEGIEAVVDSGWMRQLNYDATVGLDRLELTPISQAAADQRTGRAGRLGPGACLRLWEKSAHASRPTFDTPEVQRADLTSATLQLYCWGEKDLLQFPWFQHPPTAHLEMARQVLEDLGAIDTANQVTPLGRTMARLPMAPRLARLVLEGYRHKVLRRTAVAAALISERDPFERPETRTIRGGERTAGVESDSDVLDRVEALETFQASGRTKFSWGELRPAAARHIDRSAEQYCRAVEQLLGAGTELPDGEESDQGVLRSLLAAYGDRLAKRRRPRDPRGVLGRGKGVRLDNASRVKDGEYFVCVDVDGRKSEAVVRQASLVKPEWLTEDNIRTVDDIFFHPTQKKVVARRQRLWGGLLLDEKPINISANETTARLLETEARRAWRQVFPQKDRTLNELIRRVRWLKSQLPQAQSLPDWDEAGLQSMLPDLCRTCLSLAELSAVDWKGMLVGQLSYEQRQWIDRAAPETYTLPSGRQIRLEYQDDRPPILKVRIQEMFGVKQTPTVGLGQVPVLLHLLAPNNRPQQVTDDLASFWVNTYPQVRKDLRGRYSKHAWPENPHAGT